MNLLEIFPVTTRVGLFDVLFIDRQHIHKCTGAKILKRILKENNIPGERICWGDDFGHFRMEGVVYHVKSSKNMMKVWPFQKVTLTVKSFSL